jgi:hypothetical protein
MLISVVGWPPRAGQKASREIKDLKTQLADPADVVLDGSIARGVGVVVNQILNTRARLIETERKVREQDELLERLEFLEPSSSTGSMRRGYRGL